MQGTHAARWILVPWPGSELRAMAVPVLSLSHWTARELSALRPATADVASRLQGREGKQRPSCPVNVETPGRSARPGG